MYVQCSKVYQKKTGTVSYNRKLVESYRDPVSKKPRNRTVKTLEKLPELERARLIMKYGGHKHLRSSEWQALKDAGDFDSSVSQVKVGDVYSGGGSAVAYYHFQDSGLWFILCGNLSKTSARVIKELILHQMLNPGSKSHFVKSRKTEYLYGLEGKTRLSETTLYRALDEFESSFDTVKSHLNALNKARDTVLLYDLSNSYFCGTKAELGGYGDSKEKRYDRYIVTYGLVTDQQGQPLDIKIWKGGTADSKTVADQFSNWQSNYHVDKGIWIADRSMSGGQNITEVTSLGLDYITGLPPTSQIALLKHQIETTPELFDQKDLSEFEDDNKRYVLCRHQSKGYRRVAHNAKGRRKAYNALLKIQNSPQNKNKEKLYHRAMKVLEKYDQVPFWDIEIADLKSNSKQPGYRLSFTLNREQVKLYDHIGHYYLLQTSLKKQDYSKEEIQQSYKGLHRVERCFRQLKDSLDIRPIRHWKQRRIKAHIYLSFLSLWLLKYIERKWRERGITSDIKTSLVHWNDNLKLCQLIDHKDQTLSLKWNQGENARKAIGEIESYGELRAIKSLL